MFDQSSQEPSPSLSIPLQRGPFQNNGASPWYAEIGIGTPAQQLKFSFDTGSNFIWVTSTLCKKGDCTHHGKWQFNYNDSKSFHWLDKSPLAVNFGPWGDMQVETGRDLFTLTSSTSPNSSAMVPTDFYLSKSYSGKQFDELDWDGGIGMPSLPQVTTSKETTTHRGRPHQCEQASFHLLASLMEQGNVSTKMPFLAFDTDVTTGKGVVTMGELNRDYQHALDYLFLPFEPYSIAEVSYIWTTKLTEFSVGNTVLAKEIYFALDSGSSQYKGDPDAMFQAFLQTLYSPTDTITIKMGKTDEGEQGLLTIPPETFQVRIDAGSFQDHIIPQFRPMNGIDNLILVGSVLMDYLYTVHEYRVEQRGDKITLMPVGMWIFNKPDGPKIIQTNQRAPAAIFSSQNHRG